MQIKFSGSITFDISANILNKATGADPSISRDKDTNKFSFPFHKRQKELSSFKLLMLKTEEDLFYLEQI